MISRRAVKMANTYARCIFKKYLFIVLIPVVAEKVDGCPNKGL